MLELNISTESLRSIFKKKFIKLKIKNYIKHELDYKCKNYKFLLKY